MSIEGAFVPVEQARAAWAGAGWDRADLRDLAVGEVPHPQGLRTRVFLAAFLIDSSRASMGVVLPLAQSGAWSQ